MSQSRTDVSDITGVPAPPTDGWPAGFSWGTATASFQIEGDGAGRGDSIWDELCRQPGRIKDASDGQVACDHVNRYVDDVRLMSQLGSDAYRFSISWPRVQPGARGDLAPAGIGFYDRLVDELLGAGVEPWVTLYHWDLPVEIPGGWTQREVVDRFTDYVTKVHSALGDRVGNWFTLNEPWCSAWLGYGNGAHAPGVQDRALASRATHHLLLAHGSAVRALRAQAPADHRIGIVLNIADAHPAPGREADPEVRDAVRIVDGVQNRIWLDPVLRGEYPQDILDHLPALAEVIQDGDLETIAAPIDLLGINYYNDHLVDVDGPADRTLSGLYATEDRFTLAVPDQSTGMGWPLTPAGLTNLLLRVPAEYPEAPPMVITENGSAWPDGTPPEDGSPLPDPQRVGYLNAHLTAVLDAVRQGADVRGYFAWSLLDNFEWAWGYTQRFGIVHVDFETQKRTPKASYEAYRKHIAAVRARQA